ncbi:MAG: hypothetical protein U0353_06945 [Sandaracinus sp.]
MTRDPSGETGISDVMTAQNVTLALATVAIGSAGIGLMVGLRNAREMERRADETAVERWGRCIESRTLDGVLAAGSIAIAGPFVPLEKALAVTLSLITRAPRFAGGTPLASLASILIARLRLAGYLTRGASVALRTVARGASTILTPLLVAEGFYDIGVISGCASALVGA